MSEEETNTIFRKATEQDLPRILAITVEVVALLNAEGNFQWNSTYPLESDFRQDLDDKCLWVAIDSFINRRNICVYGDNYGSTCRI